jgi:hypothetical protein
LYASLARAWRCDLLGRLGGRDRRLGGIVER